jgi:hypothetical protein
MRPVAKCQSLPSRLRRIPKQRGRQLMTRSNKETPVASQRRPGPCGSGSKGTNQKSRNPAPFICASILIGDQRGQCMECSTYPQNCGHAFDSDQSRAVVTGSIDCVAASSGESHTLESGGNAQFLRGSVPMRGYQASYKTEPLQ